MISFNYEVMQGSRYLLPMCEVYLIGRTRRERVRALIDSGATYSIFPEKLAQDAEIELPAAKNFPIQFGGSIDYGRLARVTVAMKETRWSADIVFVERLAFPYALLGRRSIFAQFNEIAFLEKLKTPRVEFR